MLMVWIAGCRPWDLSHVWEWLQYEEWVILGGSIKAIQNIFIATSVHITQNSERMWKGVYYCKRLGTQRHFCVMDYSIEKYIQCIQCILQPIPHKWKPCIGKLLNPGLCPPDHSIKERKWNDGVTGRAQWMIRGQKREINKCSFRWCADVRRIEIQSEFHNQKCCGNENLDLYSKIKYLCVYVYKQ